MTVLGNRLKLASLTYLSRATNTQGTVGQCTWSLCIFIENKLQYGLSVTELKVKQNRLPGEMNCLNIFLFFLEQKTTLFFFSDLNTFLLFDHDVILLLYENLISRRRKQGKINTHSYIELNSRGSNASKILPELQVSGF